MFQKICKISLLKKNQVSLAWDRENQLLNWLKFPSLPVKKKDKSIRIDQPMLLLGHSVLELKNVRWEINFSAYSLNWNT